MGIITFSNNSFKSIIQNINFQNDDEEAEVDIYNYKIFSIYKPNENFDLKLNKKKKKNSKKQNNNERFSLIDILSFPEEFLNEKIFKIEYDIPNDAND